MKLVFNERKAAQAAAYLLKTHGGELNYMALIKLLYLADRDALLKVGYPITGGHLVSLPHGPVLSQVLDLINMPSQVETPWFEYISSPERYHVSLKVAEPETDELSEFEMETLRKVHERYGSMDQWQLRDLTHTLPEWDDPHGSSLPIEPERILREGGKPPEWIERVVQDAEEAWFYDNVSKATQS
ncbi:MAG: Panacea domain-containing protein [bacterium]